MSKIMSCCSQSPILRVAGRCIVSSAEKSRLVPIKTSTKISYRLYNRGGKRSLSEVVVPVNVKPVKNPDDIAVNEQISGGGVQSKQIVQIINQFWKKEEVKALAAEYGLEGTIYQQVDFENFVLAF